MGSANGHLLSDTSLPDGEHLAEFLDGLLREVGLHGRLNATEPTGHEPGDAVASSSLPRAQGVDPGPPTLMMLALAEVEGRSASDARRSVQRLAKILEHLDEPRDPTHHFDVEPAAVAEQTAVTLLVLSELDPDVYARYVAGEAHIAEVIFVLDAAFDGRHSWVLERMVVTLMTATRAGVSPLFDPGLIRREDSRGWRGLVASWWHGRRRTLSYDRLLDGRAAEIAPFGLCCAWTDELPPGTSSPEIEHLAALVDATA